MEQSGVPVERIINAGGIPQTNLVLNQIYANVLGKPVLVPAGVPTSLGSGIIALMAAGVFSSIEQAQEKMCLPHKTFAPNPEATRVYDAIYALYSKLYFALGSEDAEPVAIGEILPTLRRISADAIAE
jgi:L-ribulokinase